MNTGRICLLLLLLLLLPRGSGATACWGQNWNSPLVQLGSFGVVPDGQQGLLLFFTPDTNRVLRFGANGCLASGWPAAGIGLPGGGGEAMADGLGGALVRWVTWSAHSYYVHFLSLAGDGQIAPGWDPPTVLGDRHARWGLRCIADGSGGTYWAWSEWSVNARVLRLNSVGDLAAGWTPNGRSFDSDTVSRSYTAPLGLVRDGSGGVLMLGSVEVPGGAEIRGQRFTAGGDRSWADGGVVIREAGNWPGNFAAISDGAGGAIIAWHEDPDGGTPYEGKVYAQHVRSDGVPDPLWPSGGVLLSTGPLTYLANHGPDWISFSIVSDGGGGAIVAWTDARDYAVSGFDLYAQRVTSGGGIAPSWPTNGRPLCRAPGDQGYGYLSSAASDGGGGAYVAWPDQRAGLDVYATGISGDGTIPAGWVSDGTRVPPESHTVSASGPFVVPSADGVIVVWTGPGYPYGWTYMAKLVNGGLVAVSPIDGTAMGGFALQLASANPSTGRVLFTLRLPKESPVQAEVLDASGRRIRSLSTSTLGGGAHRLEWDARTESGFRAASGTYFLRVRAAGQVATQEFTVLR